MMTVRNTVICDMVPSGRLETDRHFGGRACHHLSLSYTLKIDTARPFQA